MSTGVPGPADRSADSAAARVREVSTLVPDVAVVLGSGLADALGDSLQIATTIAYTDLPGFVATGVPGHVGQLHLGTLADVPVAAFSGRFHLYEGHGPDVPALLPRPSRCSISVPKSFDSRAMRSKIALPGSESANIGRPR